MHHTQGGPQGGPQRQRGRSSYEGFAHAGMNPGPEPGIRQNWSPGDARPRSNAARRAERQANAQRSMYPGADRGLTTVPPRLRAAQQHGMPQPGMPGMMPTAVPGPPPESKPAGPRDMWMQSNKDLVLPPPPMYYSSESSDGMRPAEAPPVGMVAPTTPAGASRSHLSPIPQPPTSRSQPQQMARSAVPQTSSHQPVQHTALASAAASKFYEKDATKRRAHRPTASRPAPARNQARVEDWMNKDAATRRENRPVRQRYQNQAPDGYGYGYGR